MSRIDWALLGLALVLAVSTLAAPTGGIGVDGRHILAAALLAFLARPTLATKEPS